MANQFSVAVRNARLDVIETTIGTSPVLEIRSGSAPANCAAADTGTLLASLTLPTDWMQAAASGSKLKSGTWEDPTANAGGTAAHFRVKDSTGTTCHWQGTVSDGGGAGDLKLVTTTIVLNQPVSIATWTLNEPHA